MRFSTCWSATRYDACLAGSDREALRNCLSRAFDHAVMKRVARQFAQRG